MFTTEQKIIFVSFHVWPRKNILVHNVLSKEITDDLNHVYMIILSIYESGVLEYQYFCKSFRAKFTKIPRLYTHPPTYTKGY